MVLIGALCVVLAGVLQAQSLSGASKQSSRDSAKPAKIYTNAERAVATSSPTGGVSAPITANDIATMIHTNCAEEWTTDFRMRVYCETRQKEALTVLASHDALMETTPDLRAIRAKCQSQWSTWVAGRLVKTDFHMVNYCETTKREAVAMLAR
jgi:hypothetical protein